MPCQTSLNTHKLWAWRLFGTVLQRFFEILPVFVWCCSVNARPSWPSLSPSAKGAWDGGVGRDTAQGFLKHWRNQWGFGVARLDSGDHKSISKCAPFASETPHSIWCFSTLVSKQTPHQKKIAAHLHQLMPRKLSMWHSNKTIVFHCFSAFQTNSSLTPPWSQCGGMVPSHGKVNDTASGVAGPTSPAPLMAATLQR